jgi:hypothetical protein
MNKAVGSKIIESVKYLQVVHNIYKKYAILQLIQKANK